jgi:hypothetical protein
MAKSRIQQYTEQFADQPIRFFSDGHPENRIDRGFIPLPPSLPFDSDNSRFIFHGGFKLDEEGRPVLRPWDFPPHLTL